jgi:Carboxypeptidase regulatory-like domain
MQRFVRISSCLWAAILLSPICGFAQNAVSTGALSGTCRDPQGLALQNVAVELSNDSTGLHEKTLTNAEGVYLFSDLSIGKYEVTFSLAAFRTADLPDVEVTVGHTTNADVALQLGAVSDKMIVEAAGTTLNPTDTNPSTVIEKQVIDGLPLSGRRYTDFVLLTPNVTMDGEFGHVSFAGQQGGTLSGYSNTSGGSSNANGTSAFTVDGSNATSVYYGDARGFTRIPYLFGLQSVQEFQVVPNAYNAAYGGASAGFINTVTKSGGNLWHGDAFYYNRNSGTGANDAVDKASGYSRPLNVLQQFGADIGGPVVKNRLFFYFDYEQQRQLQPLYVAGTTQAGVNETSFGVPAGTPLPAPDSHFPAAVPVTPAEASANPLNPLYLQGVSNALNVIQSNIGARERRRDDVEFFPKADWQVGSNDRLTFLYNYNRFTSPGGIITFSPEGFGGIEALGDNGVRDHVASINWSHIINSSAVNNVHASWVRDEQLYNPTGLVNPSAPLVQLIQPQFFALGNETFSYNNLREYQLELTDRLTYVHGRHQLEFGVDFNRARFANNNPGTFYGQYLFLTLQNFALGKWDIYTQGAGNPRFNFSVPYFGTYVNDTMRLRPNFTLSAGIREDFQIYPNPAGNPALPFSNHFNNQYQRISPRVGFSWQVLPKTVVRGGIGLYYGNLAAANYQSSTQQNGVASQQASLQLTDTGNPNTVPTEQAVVFPNRLPSNDPRFAAGTNIAVIAPGFKSPSVTNASLQIDQEIAPRTKLTAGSMWSHGVHLTSSTAYDLNELPPSGQTTYIVCPQGTPAKAASCSGQATVGPNLDSGLQREGAISSQFGQINALISPGVNNYVSFFTQVNRQVSHGLSVVMAYTLSKTTQSGVDFYNQFDLKDTRGLSLQDQRHRLSVAAIWTPQTRFTAPAAKALLSNWSISLLSQFNSGHPYTGRLNPSTNGSYLNDSAALQTTANSAAGLAGRGPAPNVGLNAFTGTWITEIDMGLKRKFRLTEHLDVTFEAQVFNLLNSANYFIQAGGGINSYEYNPTGPTCGNGTSLNQTCYLVPAPGFQTFQSISQPNGPRIFQFSLRLGF